MILIKQRLQLRQEAGLESPLKIFLGRGLNNAIFQLEWTDVNWFFEH